MKILQTIRQHQVQIALVLAVLSIFLANAVGLFEIILDIDTGTNTYPAVVRSREFITLMVLGLCLSVALPILSPIKASILTAVAVVPLLQVSLAATTSRPLVPLEYSLLTLLMLFVVNVLMSYYTDNQEKQKLIDTFSYYVPPALVKKISQDPESFTLEGEARELTIMFCDVHNFSGISERLSPKQLTQLLNMLFTPLTRILYKHHATIDKYIGDAIMAFWGAPVPDPHHARNALAAAIEMQEVLDRLGPHFEKNGWPVVTMGIGLNTGVVSVGNMGSEYRMAYTVIGDAVNLAARFQKLTSMFKTNIIVGEETKKAFPLAVYRELGLVQVKGKNSLVRVYEPSNPAADPESSVVENMVRHNKGLEHYYNRDWSKAAQVFESLRTRYADDPLYPYYLRRIAEFTNHPPPANWRGQVQINPD